MATQHNNNYNYHSAAEESAEVSTNTEVDLLNSTTEANLDDSTTEANLDDSATSINECNKSETKSDGNVSLENKDHKSPMDGAGGNIRDNPNRMDHIQQNIMSNESHRQQKRHGEFIDRFDR